MYKSELLITSLALPAILALGACAENRESTPEPAESVLTISPDGCLVTAVSIDGGRLVVGASTINMGGEAEYLFEESGVITKHSTGGGRGLTGYGELYNSENQSVARVEKIITEDMCPPAGN